MPSDQSSKVYSKLTRHKVQQRLCKAVKCYSITPEKKKVSFDHPTPDTICYKINRGIGQIKPLLIKVNNIFKKGNVQIIKYPKDTVNQQLLY